MSKTKDNRVPEAETAADRPSAGRTPGAVSRDAAANRYGSPRRGTRSDGDGGEDRGEDWERILGEKSGAKRLPRDIGWLLVMGGLIGIATPGVLGLDLLALGTLILWPGNRRRLEQWLACHHSTPKLLRGTMKQVGRFLDDLEGRYPRDGKR